ncbi:ABC transporter ATP-binding protein/permease [Burkholderiaceae bacterium FT117]|uniref:ABCB family ABC transporter ATP-binding protein/permease n=1 Tax=Zeimonas sediminis TaxID=2944268 RepID=UPI002342E822|nr:ABC transporter ATP-binding protein/permease [Zeimonas sediminis]MCM5570803.1 ABC transporter ATP-binding protein/permease [Zeimonas sediminis]
MRRSATFDMPPAGAAAQPPGDWHTVARLLPYLWRWRWRIAFALSCLVAAKFANVGVPLVLKEIVDSLDVQKDAARAALVVPAALLVGYGALRLGTTLFTELRELVFSRVTHDASRTITLQVFRHLLSLSLRFHLDRQMGGMSRDIERGAQGISSLISFTLYSVLPTLIEVLLVVGYLALNYDPWFAGIAIGALSLYVLWTVRVTEWRTQFRRRMNEQDSRANTRAIDALLNYETVRYFGNEDFEAGRYDENLREKMRAAIRSQASLSVLNLGQAVIIATAVTLLLWRATAGVVDGTMSLGDLVLVNAFMIQLYAPLNFLGVLYRELRQALTDMERMFRLLSERREIDDAPDARPLALAGAPAIRFERVSFGYDADRTILHEVDFAMAPGTTTAVVGASGAGKSTLARLLFRFYDVSDGRVAIDGQDIRSVTQASLRAAIGIVPQDTVLFNDTIRYNIGYGRPDAGDAEIVAAARAARLHDFVETLPKGYDTVVGERGLKLSGGEKQRVAIARALLKDPPILVLDEATSALDSRNEQAIQGALRSAAAHRTTLVVAHRLSTVADAAQILVMAGGRIVERGTHRELLRAGGEYARLWALQQREEQEADAGGSSRGRD